MAYLMDLSRFPLHRFADVITTAELIPSRLPLRAHIEGLVPRLEAIGVSDLEALRALLADKQSYDQIGEQLHVDSDYLTLLNREVNSYRTKTTSLAKLGWLSEEELAGLADVGIRTARNLYERCAAREQRVELAAQSGVDLDRLTEVLCLSNLVRINGVGPSFARFFLDLGVRGPEDVVSIPTDEIIRRYEESVADVPNQVKLRPEDIEYCKKFSEGFQSDIEW